MASDRVSSDRAHGDENSAKTIDVWHTVAGRAAYLVVVGCVITSPPLDHLTRSGSNSNPPTTAARSVEVSWIDLGWGARMCFFMRVILGVPATHGKS